MKAILVGTRVVMVVILQTALLLAMALAFAPFAAVPGALGPTWGYLAHFLYALLLCLLLAFSHKWFNHLPIASLGFSWRRLPSHLALGFGIGAASALSVVILTAVWQQNVSLELSGQWGSPIVLLILLADVWETGFTEDLLVRGYLLPALVRRGIGPHAAVLVSVLLFTLAHFQVRPLWWLLPIAAAGLLLNRRWTKPAIRLAAPIASHPVRAGGWPARSDRRLQRTCCRMELIIGG